MKHPYLTTHSGAFLRNPRGGVEDVAEMRTAGMSWLALNIGDGQVWEDWRIVTTRARAIGVQVFPWARCRTLSECWNLLDQADLFAFRALLNIENEWETQCPPDRVREVIDDFPDVAVSFSSPGWLPNDTDFAPVVHRPMLLQVFPQDMKRDPAELPKITADCIAHAHAKGFKHTGCTFQTYGGADPDWYSFAAGKPRSYFAGDDVGAGSWAAWA